MTTSQIRGTLSIKMNTNDLQKPFEHLQDWGSFRVELADDDRLVDYIA
jgi:hypothetical protein